MTPTRQNPKTARTDSSNEEVLLKGDALMGKIWSVAVAIVFLTASWVGAGNFESLTDSGVVRAPTPLHIKPGTLVKAEFRSDLKTSSDLEEDSLLPEKVSAKATPVAGTRPSVAFRERAAGSMAPPSALNQRSSKQSVAQSRDQSRDMEEDLEKDLVVTPPPAKTEEGETQASSPTVETKPAKEKLSAPHPGAKEQKKAAAPHKRSKAAVQKRSYSVSQKPIQKVRPLTSGNPWRYPAGTYGERRYQFDADRRALQSSNAYGGTYRAMTPQYMTSEPQRRITPPPTAQRFVRDGVTVKLAPASAPGPYPPYPYEEEQRGDDILSSVSEIIGLPFAFISSFF